jgi:prepilin-type N-terminal cleavage/methylation domain-containing protein
METRSTLPGEKREAGGFTLLEVLVAITILAMAYLVILENFSLSFRNLDKLERVWQRDFTAILARETDFRVIPVKAEVEPLVGEILLTGSKFQLVLVTSGAAPGQSTLLLERRP